MDDIPDWARPGLQLLVSGPDRPKAIIIAVHGLAANPAYTWMSFKGEDIRDTTETVGNDPWRKWRTGSFWLRDFLPRTLPDVRILIYNYGSQYRIESTASRCTLRSIATTLLNAIVAQVYKMTEDAQPIIFIGHSFGGRVIQEALLLSQLEDPYRKILAATTGVIFLGTPHRGSSLASHGTTVMNCARCLGFDMSDNLVKLLVSGDDRSVSSLRDFTCMARVKAIDLVCFYELRETPLIRALRTTVMIVDEASATLDGYQPIALDTNHSKMNKYKSAEDSNYKAIEAQIKRLIDESASAQNKTISVLKPKKHFLMPYMRNDEYTPRHEILSQLDARLAKKKPNEQLRLAIYGLGGAGKTQFILDYAYTTANSYDNTFWIHGASVDFINGDMLKLSQDLHISGDTPEERYTNLSQWLSSQESGNWLFIIDNVDDVSTPIIDALQTRLPKQNGTIIFTSRDKGITGKLLSRRPENCLKLSDEMTEAEALDTFRALVDVDDHGECLGLCRQLEFLPLAIVSAASYIQQAEISIQQYNKLLATNEHNMLSVPVDDPSEKGENHSRSVMTTWKVSYDMIAGRNLLAARILDVMSVLDPQQITKAFLLSDTLRNYFWTDGTTLSNSNIDQDLSRQDFCFDQAIILLRSFSMITPSSQDEEASYRMHRLINLWTRTNLASPQDVAGAVLVSFKRHCPQPRIDTIKQCRPFMMHVTAIIQSSRNRPELQSSRIVVMKMYVQYMIHLGATAKARTVLLFILSHCMFEGVDDDIHWCWFAMGELEGKQGQYDKALEWYHRALAGVEKSFGHDHPYTLAAVASIALIYNAQGKFDDALSWFDRALTGNEKALGHDHFNTLTLVHNIASVYQNQGKYDDALMGYKRALAGSEKALGYDHPDILTTVNNIASVYAVQGKYGDALEWYNRALVGREKALGHNHPQTLATNDNIASVYSKEGKYNEALSLLKRTLADKEKALGHDDADTLTTVNNIATVYFDQGRYDDALVWYLRTVEGMEKAFGSGHPHTLIIVFRLAVLYKSRQAYEMSMDCCHRIIQGFRIRNEEEHTYCVAAKKLLAEIEEVLSTHHSDTEISVEHISCDTQKEEADGSEEQDTHEELQQSLSLRKEPNHETGIVANDSTKKGISGKLRQKFQRLSFRRSTHQPN